MPIRPNALPPSTSDEERTSSGPSEKIRAVNRYVPLSTPSPSEKTASAGAIPDGSKPSFADCMASPLRTAGSVENERCACACDGASCERISSSAVPSGRSTLSTMSGGSP